MLSDQTEGVTHWATCSIDASSTFSNRVGFKVAFVGSHGQFVLFGVNMPQGDPVPTDTTGYIGLLNGTHVHV